MQKKTMIDCGCAFWNNVMGSMCLMFDHEGLMILNNIRLKKKHRIKSHSSSKMICLQFVYMYINRNTEREWERYILYSHIYSSRPTPPNMSLNCSTETPPSGGSTMWVYANINIGVVVIQSICWANNTTKKNMGTTSDHKFWYIPISWVAVQV